VDSTKNKVQRTKFGRREASFFWFFRDQNWKFQISDSKRKRSHCEERRGRPRATRQSDIAEASRPGEASSDCGGLELPGLLRRHAGHAAGVMTPRNDDADCPLSVD